MAIEKHISKGSYGCWVHQFESIGELVKYLDNSTTNDVFADTAWLESIQVDDYDNWHGTKTMEEARDLLKNGWSAKAKVLKQKLAVEESGKEAMAKPKQVKSVAGFHPIVPNYLAGNPQSMISTKLVQTKRKVVNIVRQGNFLGGVEPEEIEAEAIKSLRFIRKIEAQGYRVNLYLAYVSEEVSGCDSSMLLVKLKGADERMNISKLAFPLVNPAMFRRIVFRWKEVYEHTPAGFKNGYGRTMKLSAFMDKFGDQHVFPKGSYGINNFVGFDVDKAKDFRDLVKLS